jgi:hypothetical protein
VIPPDAARKVRRSTSPPPREQHESAFTRILSDLVSRLPGARAAALVDHEGETVDYAGVSEPYAVKIAAAHWRIVLDETRGETSARPFFAETTYIGLRASRASYRVHTLPEGYALVVLFARAAGFGGWQRAVAACCNDLGREAAWGGRVPAAQRWYGVRVQSDPRRRPIALDGPGEGANRSRSLEILGSVASGMAGRERGWRVRVEGGLEATLVREPGDHWYVDDPQVAHPQPPPRKNPAETLRRVRPNKSR